jgi:hypothetical protein
MFRYYVNVWHFIEGRRSNWPWEDLLCVWAFDDGLYGYNDDGAFDSLADARAFARHTMERSRPWGGYAMLHILDTARGTWAGPLFLDYAPPRTTRLCPPAPCDTTDPNLSCYDGPPP